MKGLNKISGSTKEQFITVLKAAIQEQIYKDDAIVAKPRGSSIYEVHSIDNTQHSIAMPAGLKF